jgi:hypothetical protein
MIHEKPYSCFERKILYGNTPMVEIIFLISEGKLLPIEKEWI